MKRACTRPGAARQQGFTLVELVVVAIIILVLTSIALPNYRKHVVRSNRAEVEAFMKQVASAEEQWMLNQRSYTATIGTGGLNLPIPAHVQQNYNVYLNATPSGSTTSTTVPTSAPFYSITAVPKATGGQKDDGTCGTVAMDQTDGKGGMCAVDATTNFVTYTVNTTSGAFTMNCTAQVTQCW